MTNMDSVAKPTQTGVPIPPRRGLRMRVGMILMTLLVLVFFLPFLWAWPWERLDTEPPYIAVLSMVSFFGTPLVALALLVWWMFFSGARWATKFAVLACVVLAGLAFRSSVRKMEFASMPWANAIRIHLEMIWDPLPPERGGQADSRPIDLTLRPTDFPRYRGVNADGVSRGEPLVTDWKAAPAPGTLEAGERARLFELRGGWRRGGDHGATSGR